MPKGWPQGSGKAGKDRVHLLEDWLMSDRRPFPTMRVRCGCQSAAAWQQQRGEDAEISYQLSDGRWQGPITNVGDDEDIP